MWVLTYHSISSGPPPLCIAPERLGEQLDLLLESGRKAVPLRTLVDEITRGDRLEDDDRFCVTFDDGYRDFAESALPELSRRGIPATLFATASPNRERLAGGMDAPLLDREELRELAGEGVEIGAHGIDHLDLCQLDDLGLARELHDGRGRLAEWVGTEIETFAYPFGSYNGRVRRAAAAEFRAAFTTQLGAIPASADPWAMPRVDGYYLNDPWLQRALRSGRGDFYLWTRRWLRRARGSEPRRPIPSGRNATRAVGDGVPANAAPQPR